MDEVDDVVEMAAQTRFFARRRDRAHYRMALRMDRQERLLGVPVILLSTIVGTTIFATLQDEASAGWRIATGSLSVMAAALAALQTFFNFGGEAQRHAAAASGYARAWRHMWLFETRYKDGRRSRDAALEEFASLLGEIDELEEHAPRISTKVWQKVKAEQAAETRS
ncbi:SLATT domain-containing protein [Blastococcus sp. VKM Ac-2987]|uniref:SLATT domain-containing protein n=1 Tax=Blastococcus sp. VKM Ac-2987 TaxID=3004141 RepID=UPI0022AB8AD6|nr:SLATT domain-containing protein [Blastococcus sp. VKM Ac-2987]MCZ2857241.1 SLATT domain-containing protein [Blastococcus sp. VKM Ac-2987]